jgi:hypothetical protein
MKVTIQVLIERDDEPPIVDEIACLERETLAPDTLGLTLAEAKMVLAQLQDTLVKEQVTAFVTQQQTCPSCGTPRRCKGHHQIVVRSLFGTLTLVSPRLYTCACQADDSRRSSSPLAELLSERTTPELRYLEAKWAALLPYGVTVDVLEEVLPLHANHTSVEKASAAGRRAVGGRTWRRAALLRRGLPARLGRPAPARWSDYGWH